MLSAKTLQAIIDRGLGIDVDDQRFGMSKALDSSPKSVRRGRADERVEPRR